jgi:hypothetical protein
MSSGPSTFRVTDVKRAIQAAEAAGKKVARVEIDKAGKIILFPADDGTAGLAKPQSDTWDAAVK